MAASLSAYWVKFFKGAGFPQDVATKHAVVFSNNRIKPDMLPDLDKPSLKEMGIALMGDMIAILRYAKKVVEETTCERFLVDSEDCSGMQKPTTKSVVKKGAPKAPVKTVVSKVKIDSGVSKKIIKVPSGSVPKPATIKKTVPATVSITTDLTNQRKQTVLKRKLEEVDEFDSSNEDEWNEATKKSRVVDSKGDKVGYTVILPKESTTRSQQILKKSIKQKRTVFDRLGDSSVTSTTNPAETPSTFSISGLGKDLYKRPASVFNRLGDKDTKKDSLPQISILKNGNSSICSPGILKTRSPSIRTSIITTKKVVPRSVGTMRADQEVNKKVASNSVKQLVTTTKKISFNDIGPSNTKIVKSNITSGKLASERLTSIPAKARLGTLRSSGAKQVTFNKIATVTHVKKPDVFSRLGI